MPHRMRNLDTGSLKVGHLKVAVGDRIHIVGESQPRTVTYVMGFSERGTRCAVCKGTGDMPVGDIEFAVIPASAKEPDPSLTSPSPPDSDACQQGEPEEDSEKELHPGLPSIVLHADWGKEREKRKQAKATLGSDGQYLLGAAGPVSSPTEVLSELSKTIRTKGSALAGFDFAIGLPREYAKRAKVKSFLHVLPDLGKEKWKDFFSPSRRPEDIALTRPFYPDAPGNSCQEHLTTALGVDCMNDLLRVCERRTDSRRAGQSIFWLVGGNQVGKGTISGWKEMLQPSLTTPGKAVKLWPFEGTLPQLLLPGKVVVVETYPAEFYAHFKFTVRKREQASRKAASKELVKWAEKSKVKISSELLAQLDDGFGPTKNGEDSFDAVVGLCGMLNILLGHRVLFEPKDLAESVNVDVEGWMFGMASPGSAGSTSAK